jgi:hypothetical protein
MIGSRLHKKAGDQNYDFSSYIGSVFDSAEIRSLFAFKEFPDILAIVFPYSFCRSRLLEFQLDRLLATNNSLESENLTCCFALKMYSLLQRKVEFDRPGA